MKIIFLTTFLLPFYILSQDILFLNGKASNYHSCGSPNLYANAFEVTNKEYLDYVNWLRQNKGDEAYLAALPDTNVWNSKLSYNNKYVEYYFRHPAYATYPVVGISSAQAKQYCDWLSQQTNLHLNDSKIEKITFRLPSIEEWEMAARGGKQNCAFYPWGTNSIHFESGKYKGSLRANTLRNDHELFGPFKKSKYDFYTNVTVPVAAFDPNAFGLYQMAGNVAELTLQEGIVKGGSWKSGAYAITIAFNDSSSETAAATVGFRIFAEIDAYKQNKAALKVNASLIDKQCLQILNGDSSSYISKFEVSNELYNAFLKSLDPTKLAEYTPQDSLWKKETSISQYQNYHTQFLNYPVSCISKEAMISFCNWLTQQYNNDPKRKFNKVKIQLPSYEQWQYAASDSNIYCFSWHSCFTSNQKGVYLMNFNPIADYINVDFNKYRSEDSYYEEKRQLVKASRSIDGHALTCPIDAFNLEKLLGYKLPMEAYNLNGNVAEAVSNSELALGGSFASFGHECMLEPINYIKLFPTFRTGENIELPSPLVGFRFVMLVEQ